MEDNMNKRMGMTGSDRFSNGQSSRNNNLNNTQSINRVGVNASQARLNSALRARKYGETQSMNYVNPGMQSVNNARNMGGAQSRNNVQRNHNYSVQDDWSGKESNRVQSYNTQKMNTTAMKQMQQQVQAQSNQSYNQPQDMVQSKQQNVMNDSQTQQSANRGPQRPGVSASTGTMYPVPYNMTPNQDVSARRSAIRTNVIEENNMMTGETRRPQYDNIPVYFDDKKKKFNKKTLIPIVVCFMLVAVAGVMVATTLIGASTNSEAGTEEREKKVEKTGDVSMKADKVVLDKIVEKYNVNAAETTTAELAKVDKLEFEHDTFLSLEWVENLVGLKLLRMKECSINDRLIKTIKKGSFVSLQELDLSGNSDFGDVEFIKDIESLQKLDVTDTAVSENKINELKEYFKEAGQEVKINSKFGKEY